MARTMLRAFGGESGHGHPVGLSGHDQTSDRPIGGYEREGWVAATRHLMCPVDLTLSLRDRAVAVRRDLVEPSPCPLGEAGGFGFDESARSGYDKLRRRCRFTTRKLALVAVPFARLATTM